MELRAQVLLHVVLDEPLDLVAGVFVLGEFHTAVFKLVFELWWAEQNDSSANRPERWEEEKMMKLLHRAAGLLTLPGCSGSGGGPQSWCEQIGTGPWARQRPSQTRPERCSCHHQRTLEKNKPEYVVLNTKVGSSPTQTFSSEAEILDADVEWAEVKHSPTTLASSSEMKFWSWSSSARITEDGPTCFLK